MPPNASYRLRGGDCDDTTNLASPALLEVCDDLIDNNCNGEIDEEVSRGHAELDKEHTYFNKLLYWLPFPPIYLCLDVV